MPYVMIRRWKIFHVHEKDPLIHKLSSWKLYLDCPDFTGTFREMEQKLRDLRRMHPAFKFTAESDPTVPAQDFYVHPRTNQGSLF